MVIRLFPSPLLVQLSRAMKNFWRTMKKLVYSHGKQHVISSLWGCTDQVNLLGSLQQTDEEYLSFVHFIDQASDLLVTIQKPCKFVTMVKQILRLQEALETVLCTKGGRGK